MAAPLPARPAGPSRRRSVRTVPAEARERALWALTALLVVAVALLWWLAVLPS